MPTPSQTVINELVTKVSLVGAQDATAAAQGLDKALDGVAISSDQVTKAQLSASPAMSGYARTFSGISAAVTDLAAKLGSGGLGSVFGGVTSSLARFAPLALSAAGGLVTLGTAALSAGKYFSDLQHAIQQSEVQVRGLTDSVGQADKIISISEKAANSTRLLGQDLYQTALQAETLANTRGRLEELGNGLTRLAPALNAQAFTQGLANIVSASDASREKMQAMLGAMNEVGQQSTLTAGEAQRLARQFGELGPVLAQAFGTTPQGLMQLPKQLQISTVRLEEFISAAGKAPNAQAGVLNLTDAITRLMAAVDKLLGLSNAWDFFWGNVAKGANLAAAAIEKFLGKTEQAANAPSPQAPPTSTATDPSKLPKNYYGERDEQGFLKSPGSGGGGGGGDSATSKQIADDTRQTRDVVKGSQEYLRSLSSDQKTAIALEEAQKGVLDNSNQAHWDQLGAMQSVEKNTADTVNAVRDNGQRIITGLGRVLKAPFAMSDVMALKWDMQDRASGWGSFASTRGGEFGNKPSGNAGSFQVSPYERGPYQNYAIEMMIRNQLRSGGSMSSTGPGIGAAAEAADALSNLAEAGTKAAETIDIGQLGAPIKSDIDTLRGLQEKALSRAYRPDPYAEKNPEFFYSGERIFKEGQDKIYDGLQRQINKLEALQASLGALVSQGNALPQTLVNALIAAGFGDIAQKIVSAFQSSAPPSATPAPTAVQGPALTTSGTNTAPPTATTTPPRLSFNSLGTRGMYGFG